MIAPFHLPPESAARPTGPPPKPSDYKAKTPTCSNCGAKFSGDPCNKCGITGDHATTLHNRRMPSATRRRRKHGRQ